MTNTAMNTANAAGLVRDAAKPLLGGSDDYDALLGRIGEARFVLIGEASHGTHEFYRERARITRRLIDEKGFLAVAVEADWPDALRVTRFVRGEGSSGGGGDEDAERALEDFQRFPKWMWRNEDVREFAAWLRDWNARRGARVGFYGMDLYSLHRSMDEVIAYLERVDPEAAQRARRRYACFEDFGEDPQLYGREASFGAETCEDEVVSQLVELQRREHELSRQGGGEDEAQEDEYFYAEQNARLALDAERYYRAMFRGRADSWNLRDEHMARTVGALDEHLSREGAPAKIVVWAHNSHLGDARATEMGREAGELNVGQLLRERYGPETYSIGFCTYSGEVTAADDWGRPAKRKRVRPGLKGSYEELLHEVAESVEGGNFWLDLRAEGAALQALREERLQRAIGVIYRPETERWSHYFRANLPAQFDAMLHFDATSALVPLDPTPGWTRGEVPDTFPTGE